MALPAGGKTNGRRERVQRAVHRGGSHTDAGALRATLCSASEPGTAVRGVAGISRGKILKGSRVIMIIMRLINPMLSDFTQ
jgi:hypothetical protein